MIKSFADIRKDDLRGMVRRVDNLGRILVPKEYRKELGLEEDNRIELAVLPDGLLVRPLRSSKGPARRIDALGRVNIPVTARRALGIAFGDELEMFLLRDGMFIRKKIV
ncbi:MAG: AbrB/MazE/SpoVT family DNA-binding domain-containing protein [Oscillospiraceae bacterium]|nr:AbrB/MazE/SpoVT family DNA-binding domain-containing protein [Oscillospiraceae bacterium]MCL1952565.1 AbrB/MazE/SpoVT family DNA-binding domain-containing protein [Oscillospiraceae bacterium]